MERLAVDDDAVEIKQHGARPTGHGRERIATVPGRQATFGVEQKTAGRHDSHGGSVVAG
jgi:hypothetical protein